MHKKIFYKTSVTCYRQYKKILLNIVANKCTLGYAILEGTTKTEKQESECYISYFVNQKAYLATFMCLWI